MIRKRPVALGIPGLLAQDETGRVDEMLKILRERGYLTHKVQIPSERQNDKIVFDLSDLIGFVEEGVETVLRGYEVDPKKIVLIGSSMGAAAIDSYLASSGHKALAGSEITYVTISPFAKINYNLIPMLRNLKERGLDLTINPDQNPSRTIPCEQIDYVLGIDSPNALSGRDPESPKIRPITIYGLREQLADQESVRLRHEVLGGNPQELIAIEAAHEIPKEQSIKMVMEPLLGYSLN